MEDTMRAAQALATSTVIAMTVIGTAAAQPSETAMREAWVQRLAVIAPACDVRGQAWARWLRAGISARWQAAAQRLGTETPSQVMAAVAASDAAEVIALMLVERNREGICRSAGAAADEVDQTLSHPGAVVRNQNQLSDGIVSIVPLSFALSVVDACKLRPAEWLSDAFRYTARLFVEATVSTRDLGPRVQGPEVARIQGAVAMARAAGPMYAESDRAACAQAERWPELATLDAAVVEQRR
jgi:hypothetical protein